MKGGYVDNLPMRHVREAILGLLLHIAPHDSALFEVDEQMIKDIVFRTGLATFCHV
ncbi:hypothetical protein D9M68_717710 [compost metagenome]